VSISLAPSLRDATEAVLDRGVEHLLSLQNAGGWWKGELQTNVTMDAEDLMMREFLGIRLEDETRLAAAWVRSQQRADGAWDIFHGGPPNLSASVEAYSALRLAGDPADAAHMQRAREHICDLGGIEGTRVFTRIWLSLFGQWSWGDLPAMPPELILLPTWFPLNVYTFASWARQTIVPLTVVRTCQPVRPVNFNLGELRVGVPRKSGAHASLFTWAGRFQLLDRVLHGYERSPLKPFRKQALQIATEWILRRQEADGCWGGIQPPWVYSIMALRLLGYPLNHPVMRKGLEGLEGFIVREDGVRRFEACQSPVWDTSLAAVALRDAGLDPDHPALLRAAEWMIDEEVTIEGDWSVQRPGLAPGGWAFEFENDHYPDVDDTAEVIMALRGVEARDPEVAKRSELACQRAIRWTFGMQSKNGGFASFDADNDSQLVAALPFCDFGAVTDPPSADVTAHALEMLGREGLASDPRAKRAIEWLLAEQEDDGSWFGRWGANHIYGTAAAVPALVECGIPTGAEPIRRAVRFALSVQNSDGGWGEDLRSYDDANWRGRGTSTASQTAWALIALLAAGERGGAVERGADWLGRTQKIDGAWDEPEFTGTGFPGDFYINYHLYRQIFPVMALGRYLERR
jgi:squalene-hopene/tetraprenyl-beta-curcumene cyclase